MPRDCGGFRAGRIGRLAIARTAILLKEDDVVVDLQPLHNDPDEAGLIGAAHLLPPWMLNGHEGMLAVDVAGLIEKDGSITAGPRTFPVTGRARNSICRA
jgi:hypothetical protein